MVAVALGSEEREEGRALFEKGNKGSQILGPFRYVFV